MMISQSTASAHLLLMIGLDCRLSCRLRVAGKQTGMPSEVINYNSKISHPPTGYLYRICQQMQVSVAVVDWMQKMCVFVRFLR